MALEKDTVSINLAKGINQKTDDKISTPDQMSTVLDAKYDKDKRLVKRNAILACGNTILSQPGFINSVSFNTGHLSKTFAHEDQLCVVNNGSLFSRYADQNKWIFKGTVVPLSISTKSFGSFSFNDAVTVGSISIAGGKQNVLVFEEPTGNIISNNSVIGSETVLRVLGFSSSAYVLTANLGSSTNIYARNVSLTNGTLGAATAIIPNYNVVSSGTFFFPATAITTVSSVGETAFIHYPNTAASLSIGTLKSDGTVPLVHQIVGSGSQCISICFDPVLSNQFYLGAARNNGLAVRSYTFSTGSFASVYGRTVGSVDLNVTNFNMTMTVCSGTSKLYTFYDSVYSDSTLYADHPPAYTDRFTDENNVYMAEILSTGSASYNIPYSTGYRIAGKCFPDPVRSTIYLPIYYGSSLQRTFLLADMLEGRAQKTSYIIGKCLYGTSATPINFLCPGISKNSRTSVRVPNGGTLVDIELDPPAALSSQYLTKTTHISGGLLWAYDGQALAEHNFLIGPENYQISIGAIAMSAAVTTQGAGGAKEKTSFTFQPALKFQTINGSTPNPYFEFQTASVGASYQVLYTVNGVGVAPSSSGQTVLTVPLLSTDTSEDVAYRTSVVLSTAFQALSDAIVTQVTGNVVTVQNANNGAVADASVLGTISPGNLIPGSYQWTFVYKWTDRNGNVYRSLTATPITATVVGSNSAAINLWAPPITNKTINDIAVEVYRTQVNSDVLQLLTTLTMSSSSAKLAYYDNVGDATISSNSILYTNGGILDNYNIGACSAVSAFKERLVVNSADDQFAVYYSKSNVANEPINFAAELNFRIDSDVSKVEGNYQLDDKLITFKSGLIYAQSGDGANDLGQGSTFSQPFLIPGGVGTNNQNAIVLYPNGLIFRSESKGIYLLDRSLGLSYIGAPVEDTNQSLLTSGVLKSDDNQIVFTFANSSQSAVYNYFFNRWDFFTNYDADSACLWKGTYALARANGQVLVEGNGYLDFNGTSSVSYSMSVETPWLRLKGVQDYQRIYEMLFLGEWLGPHIATVQVFYNYDESSGDTFTFDATTTLTPYQFRVFPKVQKSESIKVIFYETSGSSSGQALVLNDLSALVGLKKGPFIVRPDRTAT